MENYEQRYKEALERAKCMHEQGMMPERLEYVFPELKESEEERIRKELVQYLKDYPNLPNGNYCRDDFFAWIERQGEKNLSTDFSDLRTWKYIVDAVWTEKEGIGQYLDSPFTEETAKKLQKRFGNIEQKPADKVEPTKWSEEDERILNELLDHCNTENAEWFNWLKSLRPQNTWKPSDE